MRPHTELEAAHTLDTIERWQQRFVSARSSPRVRLRRVLPARRATVPRDRALRGLLCSTRTASAWRAFADEVRGARSGADGSGVVRARASSPGSTVRRPRATARSVFPGQRTPGTGFGIARRVTIITGEMGVPVRAPLLDDLADHGPAYPSVCSRSPTGSSAATSASPGCSPVPTCAARLASEPEGDRYPA